MRGIRVGPARWSGIPLPQAGGKPKQQLSVPKIPPGISSFQWLFAGIFQDLKSYWFYDVPLWGGVGPLDQPDRDVMLELLRGEVFVPPDTLLPEFANCICEDWCDFCGFLEEPSPTLLACAAAPDDRQIKATADLLFMNVDSAFWVLHASDETLLQQTENHIENLEGFWLRPEADRDVFYGLSER